MKCAFDVKYDCIYMYMNLYMNTLDTSLFLFFKVKSLWQSHLKYTSLNEWSSTNKLYALQFINYLFMIKQVQIIRVNRTIIKLKRLIADE